MLVTASELIAICEPALASRNAVIAEQAAQLDAFQNKFSEATTQKPISIGVHDAMRVVLHEDER